MCTKELFVHSSFEFSVTCTFLNREFFHFCSDHKLHLRNNVAILTAMIFRCLLPFLNFRFFFASSLLWVPKSLFRSSTTRQADRSQRLEHITFEIASPLPTSLPPPKKKIIIQEMIFRRHYGRGGCKIKRMNIFFPQSLRWVMESRAELSTMIITELVRGEGRTGLGHPRRKLSWRVI